MIDTHAHFDDKVFNRDREEVIKRCKANGLKAIINIGADLKGGEVSVRLASQSDFFYASVGCHPNYIPMDFKMENYTQLVKEKRVVAIGEVGLDYAVFVREQGERLQKRASAEVPINRGEGGLYQKIENVKEKQKDIFKQFIDLAKEKELPMILHCRGSRGEPLKAYEEMLEILKEKKYFKGVAHCFTSTKEIAEKFLNLGFYIGFTGVITFAPELEEVVKFVPLEKILLETDCPYMSPEPYRRQRCEPWYVKFTAEKIAQIKKISFEKVVEQTDLNAQNLFRIIL